jgi:hypothetical protein
LEFSREYRLFLAPRSLSDPSALTTLIVTHNPPTQKEL